MSINFSIQQIPSHQPIIPDISTKIPGKITENIKQTDTFDPTATNQKSFNEFPEIMPCNIFDTLTGTVTSGMNTDYIASKVARGENVTDYELAHLEKNDPTRAVHARIANQERLRLESKIKQERTYHSKKQVFRRAWTNAIVNRCSNYTSQVQMTLTGYSKVGKNFFF